jgi:hypothetical protein
MTFPAARRCLETTPVARPVIYSLVGCRAGERCVIERTEEAYITNEQETNAANDWLHQREPWEARMSSSVLLSRTYDEAAQNSRNRREHLSNWPGRFAQPDFGWVVPPVLNNMTRIAVEACPLNGRLRVVGFEKGQGDDLPRAVTTTCEIGVLAA